MNGNRTTVLPAAACLSALLLPGLATGAEDDNRAGSFTFSGQARLATDYVFRGISQTDKEPQVQVQFSATHDSGLYAGVWASNTDFGGPGNSMELDPFIGFSGSVGDTGWGYDVGYWHYTYPGSRSDFDYGEFYAIGTYEVGQLSFSGSLWYAPDYFGDDFFGDGSSLAYQGGAAYAFANGFSVSGTVGEQTFDQPSGLGDQDYTYWDIGVSKDWKGFNLDLRWHDTDGVKSDLAAPYLADGRLVFSVSRSF